MPTIVCQNLISCFDSQLTETTATLKLRVAAARDTCRNGAADDDDELGNWGFLRTKSSEESSYTHPLSKNSSYSKLSPKSLQLCTENLGSETGSDTVSDCSSSIFSASPPLSPSADVDRNSGFDLDGCGRKRTSPPSPQIKSCRKTSSFPPPLTTMSGGSSLQVRRHVEEGRLIVEAVEGPFRNSYLHAERCDGRLKLSFATAAAAEEPAEQEEENLAVAATEEEEEEEEVEEARKEIETEMEMDGEKNLVEKYGRFRRCKESGHGNKGLCNNWKPALWVATS